MPPPRSRTHREGLVRAARRAHHGRSLVPFVCRRNVNFQAPWTVIPGVFAVTLEGRSSSNPRMFSLRWEPFVSM